MAFSIHNKSFWLWLLPDKESIRLINLLRSEMKIHNGSKDFPTHITLSHIDILTPALFSAINMLSVESFSLESKFIFRTNECSYFNSITLIPEGLASFNNKLRSIASQLGVSFNHEKDTHLSLAYTENGNFDQLLQKSCTLSFSKLVVGYVDEKNEIWKIIK